MTRAAVRFEAQAWKWRTQAKAQAETDDLPRRHAAATRVRMQSTLLDPYLVVTPTGACLDRLPFSPSNAAPLSLAERLLHFLAPSMALTIIIIS